MVLLGSIVSNKLIWYYHTVGDGKKPDVMGDAIIIPSNYYFEM